LFLLNQLKDKYHVCGIDNLYISARFFREAFTEKNKVLCHGLARKSGRRVPKCAIQEELKRKMQQAQCEERKKQQSLLTTPTFQIW
jgi:hypothetical protein